MIPPIIPIVIMCTECGESMQNCICYMKKKYHGDELVHIYEDMDKDTNEDKANNRRK